jgi:hypothetical protein
MAVKAKTKKYPPQKLKDGGEVKMPFPKGKPDKDMKKVPAAKLPKDPKKKK